MTATLQVRITLKLNENHFESKMVIDCLNVNWHKRIRNLRVKCRGLPRDLGHSDHAEMIAFAH